jgi:hypothetical protein
MNLSVRGPFSPSAVRQNAMYLTRKLKLGRTGQLDRLARRAGELWSTVAKWHWRFVDRQGYWLSKGQAQTGLRSLHLTDVPKLRAQA